MDFRAHTIAELAADVNEGRRTAESLVQAALQNIADHDEALNAFCAVDAERALASASAIDAAIQAGERFPLAGIPFGVKDLEDAEGYVTTYGSSFHVDDAPASTDSVLVARLRAAGAVVVGKTNTPEFGYKGKTDNVPFGASKNPWNLERSPGGSSGGSAAAIAAGMIPLATGSDGGGSIRIPAAVCGLPGFKSSQGRVPNGGPKPTGSGLLTVKGPMTFRTEDAILAMECCLGDEKSDLFALPAPAHSWVETIKGQLPERVIWSPTMGITTVDADVSAVCESAIDQLRAAGVEVIELDNIWDTHPFKAWIVFWTAARARAQGHLRGTPEWDKIDEALRPQIEMGLDAFGAADYALAIDQCHLLNIQLEKAFEQAPIILTPTTRGHVPGIEGDGFVDGEETADWVAFTMGINMTRNPAGSLPIGLAKDGMPIGMQVIGRQREDEAVLDAMLAMERVFGFDQQASFPS